MAMGEDFDLRAAMDALRQRGAQSAESHPDEVPPWETRPDIEGEWDVLELGPDCGPEDLDHDQRRSLEQAWMDGYERRREELNRRRGHGT